MSSSALFSIATRAMLANQGALQTVGHNIANASTPGYSRQDAMLGTVQGQFTGGGYFGRGVQLQTVTRAYDQFLTQQTQVTRSQSSHDAARASFLSRLEAVFVGGERGVGAAIGGFLNAMVDMASRPQDLTAREVVLGRAGELVDRITAAGRALDDVQRGLAQDLHASVDEVNGLTSQLAAVNQQIAAQQGNNHTPNDLLDQRDQLVAELSNHLQVSTVLAEDGSMAVFVGGGQRLVLGAQAVPLAVEADPFDRTRVRLALQETGGSRPLDAALLGTGSIAGTLRFQDDDLVHARALLGQLTTAMAQAVNERQALGLDLRDPPGAGSPIFGLGAPAVLPSRTNARDASGAFVANVGLSVVDASAVAASEYSLAHDGSNWMLTRLADGRSRAVASGDVVDGLRIDLGTPPPAATDRFLLQPVTRVAQSLTQQLRNPSGLAAASPLAATPDAANRGTATIASLQVVDTSVDPSVTASIEFTDDAGGYRWELRDAATSALMSSGTSAWVAGEPITLNGFELDLTGAARTGDRFAVARTTFPANDNGNALAFTHLRDEVHFGRIDQDGTVAVGGTFTDAWAGALASVGVRIAGARGAAQISAQVAEGAEQARAAKSGVNLDEEAARLMQYQQSYEAAAKILQVAQTMFDSLLDAAG